MALSREQLLTFAREGAVARLAELQAEIASIRRAFPGVAGTDSAQPRRGRPRAAKQAAPKHGRRKMSAEARRRISEAQKKRWAKQKAGAK